MKNTSNVFLTKKNLSLLLFVITEKKFPHIMVLDGDLNAKGSLHDH